jgi:predicted lipid-binding transport protein (Tim44 family)
MRMTSRSPRTLTAVLAAALATAAFAAGCAPSSSSSSNSTSKFKGEARNAAQTVEDLQTAANDNDGAKICTQLLAPSLAGRISESGRPCEQAVKNAIKDADSVDMTVEQVTVNGDTATARVKLETGKKDRRANFQLQKDGGRWKIQSL